MTPRTPEPDKAVYVISVAAELTGLHPQTLRTEEGLLGAVHGGHAPPASVNRLARSDGSLPAAR